MTLNMKCPFCESRLRNKYATDIEYVCGTIGPDDNGSYKTGTECDKTVFRNAFLRCIGLLEMVVDLGPCVTNALHPELLSAIMTEIQDTREENEVQP